MRVVLLRTVTAVCAAFAMTFASATARAESFECLIEPHKTVRLSSAVPGLLESMRVGRGQDVKKGQIVAKLVSGQERAAYQLAQARAEFSRRKVERNEELYRKKLISIHEKDEIETESLLHSFEEREALERLKLRTLRSPIDGIVVERHFVEGEYVHEKPVVDIVEIDPLLVEAIVPVEWFGRIEEGSIGRVTPRTAVTEPREASVELVDRVVDPASGTIRVRLRLPNPDHALPAGARCRVEFPALEGPTDAAAATPAPAP